MLVRGKAMSKDKELFDLWAERRINCLQEISDRIDEDIDWAEIDSFEKVWTNEDCHEFSKQTGIAFDTDEKGLAKFEKSRKKAVLNFKKTGDFLQAFNFELYNYFDIISMSSQLHSISEDCKLLIEFLEHRNKADDKIRFFLRIDAMVDIVVGAMAFYEGYYFLRIAYKESKSGSGRGQQEAQSRRIDALVVSLNNYDKVNDKIRITKNDFRGLVNKTFEGRENYPRHPNIFKTYKEAAEEKLKVKIVFTQKGEN